jgi:hypothetical protein
LGGDGAVALAMHVYFIYLSTYYVLCSLPRYSAKHRVGRQLVK